MASNNITSLPLKPSRGRKSGRIEKTPQRGMGVAQLELLRQQELWATHFSSAAAANRPVHNFPDRRRLPPVPIFPGPLGHVTGAVSESYCCSEKKRLQNYGAEQAPPVAGGYGHAGPTYNNPNLNVENIGEKEEILATCVGKNRVKKMIDRDHDDFPSVSGNEASDHMSKYYLY